QSVPLAGSNSYSLSASVFHGARSPTTSCISLMIAPNEKSASRGCLSAPDPAPGASQRGLDARYDPRANAMLCFADLALPRFLKAGRNDQVLAETGHMR